MGGERGWEGREEGNEINGYFSFQLGTANGKTIISRRENYWLNFCQLIS